MEISSVLLEVAGLAKICVIRVVVSSELIHNKHFIRSVLLYLCV